MSNQSNRHITARTWLLIKTIVKVVAPVIGQRIYDGAVGSAGFLCESFEYLKNSKNLTTKDAETLQKKTFYGKEKKSLAYIIGTLNMILHGVEAPNIVHTNPLNENNLAEFVALQKTTADSENSWTVSIKDVNTATWDLSVKNPNKKDDTVLRDPKEIPAEIASLDKESAEILKKIRELV